MLSFSNVYFVSGHVTKVILLKTIIYVHEQFLVELQIVLSESALQISTSFM